MFFLGASPRVIKARSGLVSLFFSLTFIAFRCSYIFIHIYSASYTYCLPMNMHIIQTSLHPQRFPKVIDLRVDLPNELWICIRLNTRFLASLLFEGRPLNISDKQDFTVNIGNIRIVTEVLVMVFPDQKKRISKNIWLRILLMNDVVLLSLESIQNSIYSTTTWLTTTK